MCSNEHLGGDCTHQRALLSTGVVVRVGVVSGADSSGTGTVSAVFVVLQFLCTQRSGGVQMDGPFIHTDVHTSPLPPSELSVVRMVGTTMVVLSWFLSAVLSTLPLFSIGTCFAWSEIKHTGFV